jgi:hypothetical protein
MPFLAPLGVAVLPALAGSTGLAATVGAGTLLAGGLGIAGLAKGLFSSPDTPEVPALPAAPSFEDTQGTSLEEQRENLRGKSKTTLTSNNLLATDGDTEKKTLLGG